MISFLATLFCFFAAVQASPLSLVSRGALDVFTPKIVQPNHTTVWVTGEYVTVVWETDKAPENISNAASIRLGVCHQDSDEIIRDFDLRSGEASFLVPYYPPGDNYCIILFGDSGDVSEPFSINPAPPL